MRFNYNLVGLLLPLFLISLGYLFLLPSEIEEQTLKKPIILIVLDPIPEALVSELWDENSYPVFHTLSQHGITGHFHSRYARTLKQGWIEILTGKDYCQTTSSGKFIKDLTRRCKPDEMNLDPNSANLKNILLWNHRRFQIINRASELASLDSFQTGVILYYIKNDTDDYKAYMHSCENEIKVIQNWLDGKGALICTQPMQFPEQYYNFYVNAWLLQNGFLNYRQDKIDWNNSRAFCLDSSENGIRINLKNLYDQGIVAGSDYQRLTKMISKNLRELKTPDTDEPLFTSIYLGESIFPSSLPGTYPNIYIKTENHSVYFNPERTDPDSAVITIRGDPELLTSPDAGWVIFQGEPFREPIQVSDLLLSDLTPTILFLLKLPIGADMQGRVLQTTLNQDWQKIPRKTVSSHERRNPRVHQGGN